MNSLIFRNNISYKRSITMADMWNTIRVIYWCCYEEFFLVHFVLIKLLSNGILFVFIVKF